MVWFNDFDNPQTEKKYHTPLAVTVESQLALFNQITFQDKLNASRSQAKCRPSEKPLPDRVYEDVARFTASSYLFYFSHKRDFVTNKVKLVYLAFQSKV